MSRHARRKKIQLLETATERIGRMLAENYGIRVVYKHDLCCTDGKTIFLPVLGEKASDEMLAAIPGMIDHEAAHVLSSDFDEINKLKRYPDANKLHGIVNIVEDARIEAFMKKRWRGTKVNFRKMYDWGYKDLLSRWDQLTEWGRFIQVCGVIACQEPDFWGVEKVKEKEPELWSYAEEIRDLLEQAADLPDTAAAMALARQILERIHSFADSPPPPPQTGGQGDDSGQDQKKGDDEQAGEGQDQDDSEGPQQGSDQSGKQDDDKDQENQGDGRTGDKHDDSDGANTQPNASGDRDGDDQSNSPSRNVPESLKRDYQPSDEDMKKDEEVSSRQSQMKREAKASCPSGRGQYLIYSTDRDVVAPVSGGDRTEVMKLLNESRAITHTMRQKMMRNLIALTRSRWESNQDRGRINPRALHRVVTGSSKKVFRKKFDAPKFDTRCSLWIDHSYSMQGQKLNLAAASALLFGEVLNQLGIPFEVCGFSTSTTHYEGERIYQQATSEEQRTYSRWGGLWVGVYKAFDEDWNTVKSRCANMGRNQRHNTYDGESVRLAAQRLLQYPERRRILFLFNDGEPCPNVHQCMPEHVEYAKDVAKSVEKMIEVFAIGIKTDAVAAIYDNAVCIHSLDDLPKVMLGELDRLLRKMQRQLMVA